MPKNAKKKAKKKDKKYCLCKPTCLKLIGRAQRRRHDRDLSREEWAERQSSVWSLSELDDLSQDQQAWTQSRRTEDVQKEWRDDDAFMDDDTFGENPGKPRYRDNQKEQRGQSPNYADSPQLPSQDNQRPEDQASRVRGQKKEQEGPQDDDEEDQSEKDVQEEDREDQDQEGGEEQESSTGENLKEAFDDSREETMSDSREGRDIEEMDCFQGRLSPAETTSSRHEIERDVDAMSRCDSVENEVFEVLNDGEEEEEQDVDIVNTSPLENEVEESNDNEKDRQPSSIEEETHFNEEVESSHSDQPFRIYFDEEEEEEYDSLSAQEERLRVLEDIMSAEEYADLWETRNEDLTEEDVDNLRAFKLRMISNMSRVAFDQMCSAFAHKMEISSLYVIIHRMAFLSQVEPLWIDCCVNSCVAYTKDLKDEDQCPECSEKRRTHKGKSRRKFCYLPIIPRLQRMFANPKRVEELLYRYNYKPSSTSIEDVFDSLHYQNLCSTYVTVDDKTLDHKYFSGKNDIAFAISLDSYLLYKRNRGGPSATPLILQLYNLPPQLRTHINRIICCGVIPGPKGPKRLNTFLNPFEDECVDLAYGVKTFDCTTRDYFEMRGYNMFLHADIIALEKFLNTKGHNAKCPCRSCKIKAVNDPRSTNKTYYVPLRHPTTNHVWDASKLPLRTHQDWAETDKLLKEARTKTAREEIAQDTGIKGMPALTRVGSLNYGRGMPWDYMHLLLENVVKNLFFLWRGSFKTLTGEEDQPYVIPKHIWAQIGAETIGSIKYIPSCFVRSIKNIAEDTTTMTAEAWSFWFMYMAPHLLKGRLDSRYHNHACSLVDIMKACTKFSITHDEINDLEKRIIKWVQDYERLYYKRDIKRLPTCLLTIHGLLHLPDNIRFCGPVWATWTFWMERYCGYLQLGLKSKKSPWANLNHRVLHKAYIESIETYFDLPDDIQKKKRGEQVVEHYDQYVLVRPVNRKHPLEGDTMKQVVEYCKAAFVPGVRPQKVRKNLPPHVSRWGKLRIKEGGDSFRGAIASNDPDNERDMSYVRYEILFDEDGREFEGIYYGRLDCIFEIEFPDVSLWPKNIRGRAQLLALITPCNTLGADATKTLVKYQTNLAPLLTDLRNIKCVVGRVFSREHWCIVDRGANQVHVAFDAPTV